MKVLLSTIVFISLLLVGSTQAFAFSDQVIQQGATGDDVVELQARMQYNGYYDGVIDGVFGWDTYWSVKNFQEQFGLEVDGLVGEKMKDMLVKATDYDEAFVKKSLEEGRRFTHYGTTPKEIQKGPKGSADQSKESTRNQETKQPEESPQTPSDAPQTPPQAPEPPDSPEESQANPPNEQPIEEAEPAPEDSPEPAEPDVGAARQTPRGYTENDIRMMAQAVYGEARGEPYVGQVAVAAVILNRVNSPIFPDSVNGVIFEPRAFTAVADGQIWLEPNQQSRNAVIDAINGQDPTGNAIYYFNPDTATSGWIWTRPQIKRIGKHIFCH
nr:spore cortex-lytic enzyme [Paenalkalicoccus suaedae]